MKRVERNEVLGIGDYEVIRERFRARVIEEKRARRVALGPKATAIFENHDTVLLQIQEMIRTERITREAAIQHEIETYNVMIPARNELSATLFLEIADKAEREALLRAARGIERHVALIVGGERFAATWEPSRELEDRASAVQYLRFPLSAAAVDRFREAARASDGAVAVVELIVDHPAYSARAPLTAGVLRSLVEDFDA